MDSGERNRRAFLTALGRPFLADELFDRVPDTVYFVKDAAARYVAVNDTLVRRCGLAGKDALIGRSAADVFAAPLGESFAGQDVRVLRGGVSISGQLERHLYPDREEGWCLTWKEPLVGIDGSIVGLVGISRDVPVAPPDDPAMAALSRALRHIDDHLDEPLRLPDLARLAGLSVFQFDQRVRSLFGLTAGQYVTRARIDRACSRLRTTEAAISLIALDCGYADQAAFSRQFRKSVGLTPKAYRSSPGRPRG